MSNKTRQHRKIIVLVLVIAFVSIFSAYGGKSQAASISQLRSQASQLQKEIAANQAQAEELEEQGDSLESAVRGYDMKIGQANKEIRLTQIKIAQLTAELKAAKVELTRQKGLLEANMKALYKRTGASSVELLVASENFSEFIDQQEYLERLKAGIQDSAEKIVELKKQIEANKANQEKLLSQQKAAKAALADARRERADLLARTRGQEALYRDHVAALQAKRAAVEKELTRRLLAGNYVNLGSVSSGQMIGRVGMTGFTFGPHLHFEARDSGANPVNPGGSGGLNYGMTWPVPGYTGIAQSFGCGAPYGWYVRKCANGTSLHAGLDIPAPVGTPIVAARSGIIVHRGNDGDGYGIKVIIKHDNGMFSYYAHLNP